MEDHDETLGEVCVLRGLAVHLEAEQGAFSMRKVAGVLLAAAMLLSVGLLAAPAGAATGGSCATLATKPTTAKGVLIAATLSKCTPTSATGGGGSGVFKSAPTGTKAGSIAITITWASGHGTTTAGINFKVAATVPSKCPKGTGTFLTITGTVTGGKGTAVKTITKGQKVTASVCSPKATGGSDTLEPGTSLKF